MKIIKLISFTVIVSCQSLLAMEALRDEQLDTARRDQLAAMTSRQRESVKKGYIQYKERERKLTKIRKELAQQREKNISSEQAAYKETAATAEVIRQLGVRPLIIIFDQDKTAGDRDSGHPDEGQDASADANEYIFIAALQDERAPIIVSRRTWDYIINHVNRPLVRKMPQFLSRSESFTRLCQEHITKASLKSWDVFSSKDGNMLIFIAQKGITGGYLKRAKTFIVGGDAKNISDGALLLGMQVNTLEKINTESLMTPRTIDTLSKSTDLKTYLKEILVTHKEVKGWAERYLNRWDMCLIGHGSSTQVAGMSAESFPAFLDFLNSGINTRSLFYLTCHSGAHLARPYQFIARKGLQSYETQSKDLNYLIISASVFDLGVQTRIAAVSFNDYFSNLQQYFKRKETLNAVIRSLVDVSKLEGEEILQYPAVRFPHAGWFKVPDQGPSVFQLNDSTIMRAVNAGNATITIPKGVNTIFVESQYITMPIEIKGKYMPLLVPREVRGSYYFQEIRAQDIDMASDDTGSFVMMLSRLKIKMPNYGKFLIEKLTMKLNNQSLKNGDALGWGRGALLFKDVIIDTERIALEHSGKKAMFSYDSQSWVYYTEKTNAFAASKNDIERQLTDWQKSRSAGQKQKLDQVIKMNASLGQDVGTGGWIKDPKTRRWIKEDGQ